jgi:hypothetical protein
MNKKREAACQGRPNLNRNNDKYSKPSNDQQQETALAAALRAAFAKKAVRT